MSQLNAAFMSADSKYEVQRTNNFRFIVDLSEFTNNTSVSSGDIIELACDTAGLPNVQNDPIELDYGNSNINRSFTSDFIEPDVEQILWQWRLKVYNPKTGKLGWSQQYKKTCYIVQYGPNGEVVRKW